MQGASPSRDEARVLRLTRFAPSSAPPPRGPKRKQKRADGGVSRAEARAFAAACASLAAPGAHAETLTLPCASELAQHIFRAIALRHASPQLLAFVVVPTHKTDPEAPR
jgi:hypothetical protein